MDASQSTRHQVSRNLLTATWFYNAIIDMEM